MEVKKEVLVDLYTRTLKVRLFEEKVWDLFGQNLVPGTLHLYLGQEAVAAGVTTALRKTDWVQSTHRGHGHVIAKGANLRPMMAELFGRKTGYCKGKGGSMHIADMDVGILGANGIAGGGLLVDAGYGSGENILEAQEGGVQLTAPVTVGKPPNEEKMQLSAFKVSSD